MYYVYEWIVVVNFIDFLEVGLINIKWSEYFKFEVVGFFVCKWYYVEIKIVWCLCEDIFIVFFGFLNFVDYFEFR